jgi:hypothetical protein
MARKQESRSEAVGKNKDVRYAQTNVYLPKDLKATIKIELLKTEGELSELVETLLREWLKRRGARIAAGGRAAGR